MSKQIETVEVISRKDCHFEFEFAFAKQKVGKRTTYHLLRQEPNSWTFNNKELLIVGVAEFMRGLLQQAVQKAIQLRPDMLSSFARGAPPMVFLRDYDAWPGTIESNPCSITLELQVIYIKSSRNMNWYLHLNEREKLVQFQRIAYDCNQMVEKIMHSQYNKFSF